MTAERRDKQDVGEFYLGLGGNGQWRSFNNVKTYRRRKRAPKRQGTDPPGSTPKEFADFIRSDIGKWAAVLRSAELRK